MARRARKRRAASPSRTKRPPEERILLAAAELFAQSGYSGASTRSIALRAHVNEASLYRYFASKRALFTAALEEELVQARTSLDGLRRTTSAKSSCRTLGHAFRLIAMIVTQHPELTRLLQFSALEFGLGMKPLLSKHWGDIFRPLLEHLRSWSKQDARSRRRADMTLLYLVTTVVTVLNFYSLFAKAPMTAAAYQRVTQISCETCYRVLSQAKHERTTAWVAKLRRPRP